MMLRRLRSGTTLLETLLFLGILAIMSTTILAVYISTQQTRVKQKAVAALEQTGTQVLDTMTRNIRRAEKILAPITNATGSILTLQMAGNSEFPMIFSRETDGNLTFVVKTETAALLTSAVKISNLTFRNVAGTSVTYSFTLSTNVPTIPPSTYSRSFSATVTPFADDQSEAGGCGSCSAPVCTSKRYQWYHCNNGTCEQSETTISC